MLQQLEGAANASDQSKMYALLCIASGIHVRTHARMINDGLDSSARVNSALTHNP
jgi:hypothetical protein